MQAKRGYLKALPVPIDVLGAHLEAYVTLLPTTTGLRLCNRFGRGDHARVQALPIELMELIETYLVRATREELREHWSTLLKCWENRCSAHSHYSEVQLVEAFKHYFDRPGVPEAHRYKGQRMIFGDDLDLLDAKLMNAPWGESARVMDL